MKIKKLLSLLLSAALLMTPLAACGSGAPSASGSGTESGVGSSAGPPDLSQDTEEVDTGDASLDDPRNQDQIGEKELLVVSFGTSYNDSRRLTIGAIETALAEAFPDWSVRRPSPARSSLTGCGSGTAWRSTMSRRPWTGRWTTASKRWWSSPPT